jgi:hypothetical protein
VQINLPEIKFEELKGIKDGEQGTKQAPQTLNNPRPAASTTAPQTLC